MLPEPRGAEEEVPAPVALPRGRGRPRKNQGLANVEGPPAPPTKLLKGEQPTTTRITRAQALDFTAQGDPAIDGTAAMAPRQGQTKMQAPVSGRKRGRPRTIPIVGAEEVGKLDVGASGNVNNNSDVEEDDVEQLATILPRKRGRPPKAKPTPSVTQPTPEKRGRGRPPKNRPSLSSAEALSSLETIPTDQPTPEKRGRGRPPKNKTSLSPAEALSPLKTIPAKRGRGRPRKTPLPDAENVDAMNVDEEEVEDADDADGSDNKDKEDVAEPMIIAPRKRGRPPKAKPDVLVAQPTPEKRGPGRPPKNRTSLSSSEATPAKRGRGRPPKNRTSLSSTEATPAKRGRGRPPKTNPSLLIPKIFNLHHALGSYKVECPAIAEFHAPGSSFDIDFCSVVNVQGEEILTASFDFIAFEGTMRCAISKHALEHFLTHQQNQEADDTSVNNEREDDDAPIAEITSDLIPTGSKRKASDIDDDDDENDEAPPLKQVKLSSPPVLRLILRGREEKGIKCFESLEGTLQFENSLCKTFTAVATFPEVGEVTFEGLKVGGSGGNPGEWNDYSEMAVDAKETKRGEGDEYADIYGDGDGETPEEGQDEEES